MSREFVLFSRQFYVGETGQAILAAGGLEAAAIGAYLLSAANYIGLFSVYPQVVAAELHISVEQVDAAFAVLEQVGFIKYDRATSTLWIINGARMQFQGELKKNGSLKKDVNKVKMVRSAFTKIHKKCPLRWQFHSMYAEALCLEPLEPNAAQLALPEVKAEVTSKSAPVVEPVAVPVEAPAPVEARAPVASLTPPPVPVVALVPVAADRDQAADGSFPRRSSADDDTVDAGIEPSAEDMNRILGSSAMELSHYHAIKRMLMGLREQCRDQYPASGDEPALALVEHIRKEKGPYRAHACIRLAMTTDDLDMNEARLAVFGEELVTEDGDI